MNRLYGCNLARSTLNEFKTRASEYYFLTKRKILDRIVHGSLIHADETRANIKGHLAYVWVLTNLKEVVYILAESREGEIVQELLRGFHGVLVSDFYAAYDAIRCPQQKCLIHLMRDLNDEILNNPFDAEMKSIAVGFAGLLKPMVDTIDRRGLRKSALRKHLVAVERFYGFLDTSDFKSEAAFKCKQRFEKNRDKLFTFLRYDGVPWNNNNAEHAIKAFARLREVMAGSSSKKGVDEYLTLLSVAETCEYRGLDFLNFLRSGEKDIETFARGYRRYPRKKQVEGSSQRPRQESPPAGNGASVPDKLVDLLGDVSLIVPPSEPPSNSGLWPLSDRQARVAMRPHSESTPSRKSDLRTPNSIQQPDRSRRLAFHGDGPIASSACRCGRPDLAVASWSDRGSPRRTGPPGRSGPTGNKSAKTEF